MVKRNQALAKPQPKIGLVDAANGNKLVFDVGGKLVVVDRVKPPAFYIAGVEITEYDARSLQRQVAMGDLTAEEANSLCVTDATGAKFQFNDNGTLKNKPAGYDVMYEMVLSMIR
jgi:hypothetical protein